jgi:hypothetical protein
VCDARHGAVASGWIEARSNGDVKERAVRVFRFCDPRQDPHPGCEGVDGREAVVPETTMQLVAASKPDVPCDEVCRADLSAHCGEVVKDCPSQTRVRCR